MQDIVQRDHMDAETILVELIHADEGMPRDILAAVRERRAEMTNFFIGEIEDFCNRSSGDFDPDTNYGLFYMVHLLAEWRETRAYRPICRLLQHPDQEWLDIQLNDSITESLHKALAAICDGDAEPLKAVAANPGCNEFIRHAAMLALAMTAASGIVNRQTAIDFVQHFYDTNDEKTEPYLWISWMDMIIILGLENMTAHVWKVFDSIPGLEDFQSFKDFKSDFAHRLSHGDNNIRTPPGPPDYWELFTSFEEEFCNWYGFMTAQERAEHDAWMEAKYEELLADTRAEKKLQRNQEQRIAHPPYEGQLINQYRNVGRNDPCPCGSGKKFKKCCRSRDA